MKQIKKEKIMSNRKTQITSHPDGMFAGTVTQADNNGIVDTGDGEQRSLTIVIRMDEPLTSITTEKGVTVPKECYPHNVEEMTLGYLVKDGLVESVWPLEEDNELPFNDEGNEG